MNLVLVKQYVKECLKTQHKVYVRGNTIYIHKDDVANNNWGFVKLGLIISGTDFKPNWNIKSYNKPEDFGWEIILG